MDYAGAEFVQGGKVQTMNGQKSGSVTVGLKAVLGFVLLAAILAAARSSAAQASGASRMHLEDGELSYHVFLPLVRRSGQRSTPAPTVTLTPTVTATGTLTITPTRTPSVTATTTATPTRTPSVTASPIPGSATPTPTASPTETATPVVGRCRIENGGFEEGAPGEAPPWMQEGTHAGELVDRDPTGERGGRVAYFGGEALSHDVLYQAVAIPSGATEATLTYTFYVQHFFDPPTTLSIELRDLNKQRLQQIATIDLSDPSGRWLPPRSHVVDLSPFAGQTLLLYFDFQTRQANAIFVDNVQFNACVP